MILQAFLKEKSLKGMLRCTFLLLTVAVKCRLWLWEQFIQRFICEWTKCLRLQCESFIMTAIKKHKADFFIMLA